MAKIGLKYPVYAPVVSDDLTGVTYGTGAVLAKAISANVEIKTNDVTLYADDVVAESDRSFSSGTVKIGIDDLYDQAKVALLGYIEGATVDPLLGTKVLSASGTASGAYVGFGFYGRVKRGGTDLYRAVWLKKVQFSEPGEDLSTKGAGVEFKTTELEGSVMVAEDGTWKEEATFSTESGARTWLEGKAGLTLKCATPVSSVPSGSYTTAQSVVLTTATAGATIYYTTDGTIPSATNGTAYSDAITCAKPSNTCIKAVAVKSGYANSDILELYITIT